MKMIKAIFMGILSTVLTIIGLFGVAYGMQRIVQILRRIDPTLSTDTIGGAAFGMVLLTVMFTAAWFCYYEKVEP